MITMETIKSRHSVRAFQDEPIKPEDREELTKYIAELNKTGNLHIQIFFDEPECFDTSLAHYGNFKNAKNYVTLVGKKAPDLNERCGYYGELLVLKAQDMGLRACWVALTHGKTKTVLAPGEKEIIVIALGYGETDGSPRKTKAPAEISNQTESSPAWFKKGIEAAQLAPTAVNQQKFYIELLPDGHTVSVKVKGMGVHTKTDLGIVKAHFAIGAGKENFTFADA